jgi:hypothetical protein
VKFVNVKQATGNGGLFSFLGLFTMIRTNLASSGSLNAIGPFTVTEAMIVIVLVMIIGGAVYSIFRKRMTHTPSWTRLTDAQSELLSALRVALSRCASSAGNTGLFVNLNRMKFGGAMTAGSAAELDANAITVGTTTYFSPTFFAASICQQYRTMLHEASRVGGNYADEQNDPQGLIRLEQAEEQSFRELAACLGCCREYPLNPPPGCGEQKRSGSGENDSGLA